MQGFSKGDSDELMRQLVRDLCADPAATACSRVMPLPGFSQKYARRHHVRVERLSPETYTPDHFPKLSAGERGQRSVVQTRPRIPRTLGRLSQSELDFAYAKRALHRGEPANAIVAAIARCREGEKHNLQDYASRTVRRAAEELRTVTPSPGPDRGDHRTMDYTGDVDKKVQAIFEKGVLRRLEPLSLRDRQQVTVTISQEPGIPPDHPLLVPPEEWAGDADDDVSLEEVRRALSTIRGSLSEAVIEERRER